VSSPRLPFTTCTSTPGSFFKAAAKLAAWSRIEPQTGHSRISTFFIVKRSFRVSQAGYAALLWIL
jgi:hypothetical protein